MNEVIKGKLEYYWRRQQYVTWTKLRVTSVQHVEIVVSKKMIIERAAIVTSSDNFLEIFFSVGSERHIDSFLFQFFFLFILLVFVFFIFFPFCYTLPVTFIIIVIYIQPTLVRSVNLYSLAVTFLNYYLY